MLQRAHAYSFPWHKAAYFRHPCTRGQHRIVSSAIWEHQVTFWAPWGTAAVAVRPVPVADLDDTVLRELPLMCSYIPLVKENLKCLLDCYDVYGYEYVSNGQPLLWDPGTADREGWGWGSCRSITWAAYLSLDSYARPTTVLAPGGISPVGFGSALGCRTDDKRAETLDGLYSPEPTRRGEGLSVSKYHHYLMIMYHGQVSFWCKKWGGWFTSACGHTERNKH